MNAATVLLVDDEERIVRSLAMLLRGRFTVRTATNVDQALSIIRRETVHVVVSDQRMPQTTGVELLAQVRQLSPTSMRLLLTGYADLPAIVASVNDGEIFRYLEKPWNALLLITAIEQAAQIALAQVAAASRAQSGESLSPTARLLVLDAHAETFQLVRELVPESLQVRRVSTTEQALALLSEQEFAVLIADLGDAGDQVGATVKMLKRYSPGLLTIAVAPLRDGRSLIGLINEGQIFRFLPQPVGRELLRRGIVAALERHAQHRRAPILLARHAVEAPAEPATSLSTRLLEYWRRIRENARSSAHK